METSPGGGTRSEVGEQQARQPPAQDTGAFNLQPYTQHGKHQGEGLLTPLPFGQWRGPGTELWSASHTAGCRSGGSHLGPPPQVQPQATPSGSSPHTSKASAMIKGGGGLQLLEEGLCPFSEGVRQAWGPENTFMWQRQGAGAFSVTQAVPRNGSSRGQPLSRPEFRAYLTGWH